MRMTWAIRADVNLSAQCMHVLSVLNFDTSQSYAIINGNDTPCAFLTPASSTKLQRTKKDSWSHIKESNQTSELYSTLLDHGVWPQCPGTCQQECPPPQPRFICQLCRQLSQTNHCSHGTSWNTLTVGNELLVWCVGASSLLVYTITRDQDASKKTVKTKLMLFSTKKMIYWSHEIQDMHLVQVLNRCH